MRVTADDSIYRRIQPLRHVDDRATQLAAILRVERLDGIPSLVHDRNDCIDAFGLELWNHVIDGLRFIRGFEPCECAGRDHFFHVARHSSDERYLDPFYLLNVIGR
ncbi:hypothetical protein D9M73_172230 [compost metagenome]